MKAAQKIVVAAMVLPTLVLVYCAIKVPQDGALKAERVRMDLEIAQAQQEFSEAKTIRDHELAKPEKVVGGLSPEGITEEIELLQAAEADLRRKSNRLKLLKEARGKLDR